MRNSRFNAGRTSLIAMAASIGALPAAAAAQSAGAAAPAPAHSAPDTAEAPDVIVTGFRSSLSRALENKRVSAGAIDMIVAEDIAKFPDNNLAESVQRIPGVTIAREGGEGRQLSVRGLGPDFTRVRLNGMEALATTGGAVGGVNRGRGFDFNVFASELFSSIAVRKTPSAEVDEGSLGATVDLKTAHPFDYNGFKLGGSVSGQINDLRGRADPRAAVLLSDRFLDDRLGILVSGAYAERHTRLEGTNSGQWDFGSNNGGFKASTDPDIPLSQLNSSSLYSPRFPRYGVTLLDEKRLGLTGSVQFQATDHSRVTFDATYAHLNNTREEKYLEAISISRAASQGGKPEMTLTDGEIKDNLLLYGKFDGADVRAEDYISANKTDFQQYNVEFKQDIGDRFHAIAYGGVSKSKLKNVDTTVQMDRINTNGYSFDYRTDPKHPTLNYGFDVTNPANWYIGPLVNPGTGTIPGSTGLATGQNQGPEIRIRPITSTNKFRTGQLDLTYDLTDQIKLRAGAQFKRFSFDSVARRMATERNFPVIPAGKSVTDLTTLVNGIQHFDTSGTPTTWLVPDIRKFADIYNIYSNTGFFALQGAENASARGDIRSVVERDRNFYVQSDFKGDVFGLSLHGDVGVRFVHTAQAATGYSNVGASYSQITLKRAYDDTLPAFNIAADLTSKLVLRVSAAKVMTRPGLGSLTPGGSVSVAGGTRSVTSGNPNLDPIRAKTADIGLEWYFGAQSLLSVAGFYKDIGTYIQTLSSIQPFTASGLPTTILDGTGVSPSDSFTFSQPVNTPGGKLKGFEINYQQPLRFLPGKLSNLGVLLNYTYVTSNIKYVVNATTTTTASLVGLSKNAYNATIYYEDKKISTRVSAAYRSNYLRAVPGPFNTEFSGTKGTLNVDASLSYNLNDHFSISVDVLNITDEYDDTYVGARQLTEDYRTYGRTYMAGIRFSY